MSAIQLHKGDCLEIMKDIPDKSVDMILCDLPYGTTACKWDIIIPFDKLWEQYNRIVKDNGVVALFGSEPFASKLRLSNEEMYRYDWIWIKNRPTGHLEANNKPMKKYETISIFSKARYSNGCLLRMNYNPQGLVEINKLCKNSNQGSIYSDRPSRSKGTMKLQRFTNYPSDILCYGKDKEKFHSAQKPIALLEYLIKTYTNEGDTVLDNCMGSGSTGVACVNTNRDFIGIERYAPFEIAEQRINEAQNAPKQLSMF